MISLNRALELMRQKDHRGRFIPFSVTFVSCSVTKKTGGELVSYNHVTLPQRSRVELASMEKQSHGNKDRTPMPMGSLVKFRCDDGSIKHCHVPLITRFNGEKVF